MSVSTVSMSASIPERAEEKALEGIIISKKSKVTESLRGIMNFNFELLELRNSLFVILSLRRISENQAKY